MELGRDGLDAVGFSPLIPDERWFYMSYTGEGLVFQQPLWPFPLEGFPIWDTTPFFVSMPPYGVSWVIRDRCYLGLNCNSANGTAP